MCSNVAVGIASLLHIGIINSVVCSFAAVLASELAQAYRIVAGKLISFSETHSQNALVELVMVVNFVAHIRQKL